MIIGLSKYTLKATFVIITLSLGFSQSLSAQNWSSYEDEVVVKIGNITSSDQINQLNSSQKRVTRQYVDGLGRPIQVISLKGSPAENDIILPIAYDNLGRSPKTYLPYTGINGFGDFRPNAFAEQSSFYTNGQSGKIPVDNAPYSQVNYENSPLARIIKQGLPGDGFQLNQHSKSADYRSNNSEDLVRIWDAQGNSSGIYPVNSLDVTQNIDAQGTSMLVYSDVSGRVVLKRQLTTQIINGVTETRLDTYYIYNDNGSLSFTVPPKALAVMRNTSNWNVNVAGVTNLVFRFLYDNKSRLIQKTVPDGADTYIVYDPLNRPVLLQDGNMRLSNKWNYMKYDAKGRMIIQGIYQDNIHTSLAAIQDYVNALDYNTYYYEKRSGSAVNSGYYTNNTFPAANISSPTAIQPLSYSYYDNYDLNQDGTPDFSYQLQGFLNESAATTMTRGQLTVSSQRTISAGAGPDKWLNTVIFYDKNGRPIQSQGNNHTNNTAALTDQATVLLDFNGKILQEKKNTLIYNSAKTISSTYNYDHSDRLKSIDQSYNSSTTIRIASYNYNELGQMVYKQLHSKNEGSTFLQGIDYRYNIRGQILSINNSTLTAADNNTLGTNSRFGMEMLYDKVDAAPNTLNNTPYYNGMLSAVKWMVNAGTNITERSYKYSYDDQNRISSAIYADRSPGQGIWNNNGAYDEKNIRYDHNGNIVNLERSAIISGSIQPIDNLQYAYNGNKLVSISDGTESNYTNFGFKNMTGSNLSYTYDINGNLIVDPYKGLQINYNVLNKMNQVNVSTVSGRYINYTYSSGGQILKKELYEAGILSKTTDYIDGYLYENTLLVSVTMPEGRMLNSGTQLIPEYFITDQQGNVRLSFQERANTGLVIMKQENSYYPFGLIMPNSQIATPTLANRNLYNGGSEWQNDYGDLPDLYQTFYRSYDPATGRFTGVDPKAESSESLSPYHYAGNNPIMNNDPLGDDYSNWDDVWRTFKALYYGKEDDSKYGGKATSTTNITYYKDQKDALASVSQSIDSWGTWGYTSAGSFDAAFSNLYNGKVAGGSGNGTSNGNTLKGVTIKEANSNPNWLIERLDGNYANQGNDGHLTHAQELAKYGQIVGFGNVSISGSYGAGVAYEYGTIETDKMWLQKYQTVYSVAGAGLSGGSTGGAIIAIGTTKPTFSDWQGLATGGSVSYLFFGAAAAKSTTYYAIGASLGLGYGLKGNWNGTFSYAQTFLIGNPYPRPLVNLTRSYINTQAYLGGQ